MLFGQLLAAGPEDRPAQAEVLNPKSEQIAPTEAGPESLPPARSATDTTRPLTDTSAARKVADTTKSAVRSPQSAVGRRVTPGKAMLFSALIPGGGQFYCKNYVKGAIYAAAELGVAGVTVYEDQVMRRAYRTQAPDTLSLKNRRNALLWWTGAVWAFSVADAYVSASMYGFKEEQRFEAEVAPLGIGVCYRF
jgi:TM2 domain-containing membrane protein YozV